MTIWHMPIYKKLWRIIESGELGKVQMITVNFGSFKEYDMNNRFFNRCLAGGAMLDIGSICSEHRSQLHGTKTRKADGSVEECTDRS